MGSVAGFRTCIGAGARVTVHIENKFRDKRKLHNSLEFRNWKHATTMNTRTRGSKHHSDMLPRPVKLLNQCQSSLGVFMVPLLLMIIKLVCVFMVHPGTRQVIVFSTFQHEQPESYES